MDILEDIARAIKLRDVSSIVPLIYEIPLVNQAFVMKRSCVL